MKQQKILSPQAINQAREYTVSVVKDLAHAQRRDFEKRMMKQPRPGGAKTGNRVDNLLAFMQYVLTGDQLRRRGQHYDAIALYTTAAEAYENGVLDHYMRKPERLQNMLAEIGFGVRSFAKNLQCSDVSVLNSGRDHAVLVRVHGNLPQWLNFQTPEIHFVYTGMGRSFQKLGFNALSAENYYKAKNLKKDSARIEEGLGDAFIGNTRHRNSDLAPVIKIMPVQDEQMLISAAYKYEAAEKVLEEKGLTLGGVGLQIAELARSRPAGGLTLAFEHELALLQKTYSRIERIRAKKERVLELL
ncbi:MAG: hypothetical protein M1530_02465 [Candidatus Marsarchaeota archaeon]|nr:hypothetical protein [Candidatus Marsarchaeota archaeon]